MKGDIRKLRVESDLAFVPLTQELEAIIDAEDAHLVEGYNWHAVNLYPGLYYAASNPPRSRRPRTKFSMHALILPPRKGFEVDHINGNGLDNRRCNLRLATSSQQSMNTRLRKDNRSGLKGACWAAREKKWRGTIRSNGRTYNLGYFTTAEDAHAAYCEAASRLHGEYRRAA